MEKAAVFEDVFLGVPVGEAEIEDFLGALIGDAAGFGAETVDEPREIGERGDLKELEAARRASCPRRDRRLGC